MLFTSLSSWSLVSFARCSACLIYMCLTVYEFSFILLIHHNIHFYFELLIYCNILDIYLLWNMNSVKYLLFYMKLLNRLFCNMFGSVFGMLWVNWSQLAVQTPSKKSLSPLAAGWPLIQPNHPSSLSRTCCVLTQVNIIPKFPMKNHKFL